MSNRTMSLGFLECGHEAVVKEVLKNNSDGSLIVSVKDGHLALGGITLKIMVEEV